MFGLTVRRFTTVKTILAIVGDSFAAPNPDSGATVEMSAKVVLLKAIESLNQSDLDDLGKLHLLSPLNDSFAGLGEYDHGAGHTDKAIALAEKTLELKKVNLGANHP